MNDYAVGATEFPEDVWKTSEWIPQLLVNRKMRQLAKDGKPFPEAETVKEVLCEIKNKIHENNGLSAKRSIDFNEILRKLE